mmetsp:Transcript_33908/g.97590  ORF Transcript_33908/g.97590 Transcript_33908/m.97590 type:complete len:228 (-) Transcript_33908:96-779(-)
MSRGGKNKKAEIAAIKRELQGERMVSLTRLSGDTGTDEGEWRNQVIWQNFRITNCTKTNAAVLGTAHPDYCEGKEAASLNTQDLFETVLFPAGVSGVALEKLSSTHAHYFGSGFEKVVGKKLRVFVSERFEYDEKTAKARASNKMLAALRKLEARDLVVEQKEYHERMKERLSSRGTEAVKPPTFAPSQTVFDPDHRPRYASTKMQPDELEERGGGFDGKGGGKGLF